MDARTKRLLLLALAGLAFAMALITTAEGAVFRAQRGDAFELGPLLSGRLADWYTCAVLVPPLYWVTSRFTIESHDWRLPILVHLGASATAACLKFALYIPLRRALDANFEATITGAIEANFLGKLMFFWAVIGVLHAILFYRRVQNESCEAESLRLRLANLERHRVLAVPHRTGLRYLPHAEIDWVQAQGNYLQIHAGEQRHLVRKTMRELEDITGGDGFVRVHRSAIINVSSVRLVEPQTNSRFRITLRNGDVVTSARSYAEILRRSLPDSPLVPKA